VPPTRVTSRAREAYGRGQIGRCRNTQGNVRSWRLSRSYATYGISGIRKGIDSKFGALHAPTTSSSDIASRTTSRPGSLDAIRGTESNGGRWPNCQFNGRFRLRSSYLVRTWFAVTMNGPASSLTMHPVPPLTLPPMERGGAKQRGIALPLHELNHASKHLPIRLSFLVGEFLELRRSLKFVHPPILILFCRKPNRRSPSTVYDEWVQSSSE
jgi:hypothetical protein